MNKLSAKQIGVIIACITGLALVYLYQRVNYAAWLGIGPDQANLTFSINRLVRLLLNDGLCLGIIYTLFRNRPQYLRWAWYLFLMEVVLILPLYLVVKLAWEGPTEISSPLLSPIHRIIVNPLLMVIFIVACYLQDLKTKSRV